MGKVSTPLTPVLPIERFECEDPLLFLHGVTEMIRTLWFEPTVTVQKDGREGFAPKSFVSFHRSPNYTDILLTTFHPVLRPLYWFLEKHLSKLTIRFLEHQL